MSEKKSTSGSNRYRNFATIVYPESAPENWVDILCEQFIPCFISPLHDSDCNPDGEIKKAHYHVLFSFEGKKSVEQVEAICDLFGGVGCQVVQSLRGYARYLCHLDNPEKFQYDTALVQCFCGADYPSTIGLATDKYKAIREMMVYCTENNIFAYSDLLEFASMDRYDWFRVLCDNGTVVMKEYLKSRSWKRDRGMLSKTSKVGYNCETAEGCLVESNEFVGFQLDNSDVEF